MKRILALIVAAVIPALALFAQNEKADNILGVYKSADSSYKVKITKLSDGTYKGQVCWVAERCDANGKVFLDEKNPDKSLRNTPCDQIVLFKGLKYNADKKRWEGTKIYDPNRGLKANMTAEFSGGNTLKIRGTVMGIGETEVWTKE